MVTFDAAKKLAFKLGLRCTTSGSLGQQNTFTVSVSRGHRKRSGLLQAEIVFDPKRMLTMMSASTQGFTATPVI